MMTTVVVEKKQGSIRTTIPPPVAAAVMPSQQNLTFPWILHDMLEAAEERGFADVVSWIPGTNYFKIHDSPTFLHTIMPMYFNQTRVKSFLRQLNLYCFVRQNKGYYKGSYSHPLFIRGEIHLCRFIIRCQTKTKAAVVAAAAAAATTSSTANASMTSQATVFNNRLQCGGGGGGGGCGGAEGQPTTQHHHHQFCPIESRSAPNNTTTSVSFSIFEDMFQDQQDIVDDIIDIFGSVSMYP